MLEIVTSYLPHVLGGLSVVLSTIASAHATMYKRDSRSAAAWVGLIWLSPFLGPFLYVLLGVNRVRRRAVARRNKSSLGAIQRAVGGASLGASALKTAIDQLSPQSRLPGHRVVILNGGDEAFPAMLAAIDGAKKSVHLCTYIFDTDSVGREFVEALANAVNRGVRVRVIIDDIGANYSFPSVVRRLKKRGIAVVRFGRTIWPWAVRYANLRNHRKILVVDDEIAFAGGMNIREGAYFMRKPKHPMRDLHFRFEGPIVKQLDNVFCDDWKLVTKEHIDPCPPSTAVFGSVHARCLADGPDCELDSIRWTMLSALACSTKRVRIVTPYFVPDEGLITALCMAALRGLCVEIVLPENNNLRLVKWASQAVLWQVLQRGCRVFMSSGPFDHTKLMLVDDDWSFLGSANWDTRSLRLNFEVNMECQDKELADSLHALVDERLRSAREVTLKDVDGRPLFVRLRDGIARLFSPYL